MAVITRPHKKIFKNLHTLLDIPRLKNVYRDISDVLFNYIVAGLAPVVAGTITALGAVWNSLFNPVMGYVSDHAMTRWGRRRLFCLCLHLRFRL